MLSEPRAASIKGGIGKRGDTADTADAADGADAANAALMRREESVCCPEAAGMWREGERDVGCEGIGDCDGRGGLSAKLRGYVRGFDMRRESVQDYAAWIRKRRKR